MNCAAPVELAIPPSLRYIGSRAFLDCTVFSGLAKMPGRHKWQGVYAEECFRHLSCYAMATLAAHDPGHGVYPWSWMKTSLSGPFGFFAFFGQTHFPRTPHVNSSR